jgi:hypothetical protein
MKMIESIHNTENGGSYKQQRSHIQPRLQEAHSAQNICIHETNIITYNTR